MSDIVERIDKELLKTGPLDLQVLAREAAAEITRLRARLAAWKAEAEAWRAHTRELHRRDCGAPDRFDTYTPLVAARAAVDAIEKNAS